MIRPFQRSDKKLLLNLLRLNIPEYFHDSEEEEFSRYLDFELEDYFVLVEEGEILGCGGINYSKEVGIAYISWDIIHPDHQGKGLGSKLINHRFDFIKNDARIMKIIVRTSQFTYKFYEKVGFRLVKTKKNFWAKDIDLYEMIIEL